MPDHLHIVEDSDYHHAYRQIGERAGTEGLALVASMMEASAHETKSILARVQTSTEEDRDYWKTRAIRAEGRLAAVRGRLLGLLDPPDLPDGDDGWCGS